MRPKNKKLTEHILVDTFPHFRFRKQSEAKGLQQQLLAYETNDLINYNTLSQFGLWLYNFYTERKKQTKQLDKEYKQIQHTQTRLMFWNPKVIKHSEYYLFQCYHDKAIYYFKKNIGNCLYQN